MQNLDVLNLLTAWSTERWNKFDYIKYRSTPIILREMKGICSSGEMLAAAKQKEKELTLAKETEGFLSWEPDKLH